LVPVTWRRVDSGERSVAASVEEWAATVLRRACVPSDGVLLPFPAARERDAVATSSSHRSVAGLVKLSARIGLITLACRDVERMAQLFRDLGWRETPQSDADHRTFQCTTGVVIACYAAKHYEPMFGPPADSFRAFTLCVNVESMDEVRAVYDTLRSADSVELLGEVEQAFWCGGFSGRDPEGNIWEVAWAKGTTLDERDGLTFP
jgi:uncharacterized protein